MTDPTRICADCGCANDPAATECAVCGGSLDASVGPSADPTLVRGDTFGAFVLEERLGEGGAAEVYRARHATLGHRVAIKVLFPHFVRNPAVRERFVAEGRIQAQLRHPHIVRVTDIIDEGPHCGIVMDLVEGQSLRHWLKRPGRRSITDALAIFDQLLGAVGYAHQHGIVHRDIKPDNVLLETGPPVRAMLLDFGVAKRHDSTATVSGTQLGTPFYMAPEQYEDASAVDHRVDIYALGAMLFELVTGRVPYERESPLGVMRAHADAPIPDPCALRHDLPRPVGDAIMRALAKLPGQRFTSCKAFAAALREAPRPAPTPHRAPSPTPAEAPEAAPRPRSETKKPQATTADLVVRLGIVLTSLVLVVMVVAVVTKDRRTMLEEPSGPPPTVEVELPEPGEPAPEGTPGQASQPPPELWSTLSTPDRYDYCAMLVDEGIVATSAEPTLGQLTSMRERCFEVVPAVLVARSWSQGEDAWVRGRYDFAIARLTAMEAQRAEEDPCAAVGRGLAALDQLTGIFTPLCDGSGLITRDRRQCFESLSSLARWRQAFEGRYRQCALPMTP